MKELTVKEMVAELEGRGYIVEESLSDYYRLIDNSGSIIHDDSACEDVYAYNDAVCFFYTLIFGEEILFNLIIDE